MKRLLSIFAAGVISLSLTTPVIAQNFYPYGVGPKYRVEPSRHNNVRPHTREFLDHQGRRHYPRGYYGIRPYFDDYGRYRSGQVYRGRRHEVTNYRSYGLPRPRPGYRYYRDDMGDIVLVAVATGIIWMIIADAP